MGHNGQLVYQSSNNQPSLYRFLLVIYCFFCCFLNVHIFFSGVVIFSLLKACYALAVSMFACQRSGVFVNLIFFQHCCFIHRQLCCIMQTSPLAISKNVKVIIQDGSRQSTCLLVIQQQSNNQCCAVLFLFVCFFCFL